ncbi:MAG: hypothetical protein ABSF51_08230 [Verrucomicrobiota bacterium]|jgi:hypothetical protein
MNTRKARVAFMAFAGKLYGSPRSIACIVLSCFSLFVWYAYFLMTGTLGRFLDPSAVPEWVRHSLSQNISLPLTVLAIACRSLAVASLIWCIWCWRKESGVVVGIAVGLTGLAILVNVLIFL